MKKIILSLFLIAFTLSSIAQVGTEDFTPSKHFIGLHAGSTTGYGLSYRYWPTKFGGEITTSPKINADNTYSISTGLSLLYKLKENEKYSIYSYLGNSLLLTKFENWDYNQGVWDPNNQNGQYTVTTKKYAQYNASIGLGYKVNFWQNLDFNLQAGYGVYDLTNAIYTNVTGEIGLYYHF
jgi:hypothetical protein